MVVDPQVDQDVVVAAVAAARLAHDHRGGLAAAPVAARLVSRLERGQHPLDQRALGRLERVGERGDDLRPGQQVALGGIALAGAPARPT